jgi:thiosulfate/3-mercaptopyruvate sulfurtransferase
MKKLVPFILPTFIVFVSLLLASHASAKHAPPPARTIDPIVSTEWLAANLETLGLVILDIRSPQEYAVGHIPGSINEPFVTGFDPNTGPSSNWIVGWVIDTDHYLWLQVPPVSDLLNTIGNLGISSDSRVVIVTTPNPGEPPFYGLANATRVAFTLIYAGVKNVAVLDGGYPKWVADGEAVTTEVPVITPLTYHGRVNEALLVSIDYVKRHLRKAVIIDGRDADVYFGVTIEPFALKAGHIPSAKCLPAPWIWELASDDIYLYKDMEILDDMASGVIREHKGHTGHSGKEIIVYCGVGGYASSWWFVLTQVLGYHNVKLYDGSAQEWVIYYDMVPYQWD